MESAPLILAVVLLAIGAVCWPPPPPDGLA